MNIFPALQSPLVMDRSSSNGCRYGTMIITLSDYFLSFLKTRVHGPVSENQMSSSELAICMNVDLKPKQLVELVNFNKINVPLVGMQVCKEGNIFANFIIIVIDKNKKEKEKNDDE